jgi:hypothetical protein
MIRFFKGSVAIGTVMYRLRSLHVVTLHDIWISTSDNSQKINVFSNFLLTNPGSAA